MYVRFVFLNGLKDESALDVIEHAEVLLGLDDLHNIHDADGEASVASDLVVDQDTTLLVVKDEGSLAAIHGILESVFDQEGQGE
jgi:hypothetical protein